MEARKAVDEIVQPKFLVEWRFQKVHGDIELDRVGSEDGIRIVEFDNQEESVCVCVCIVCVCVCVCMCMCIVCNLEITHHTHDLMGYWKTHCRATIDDSTVFVAPIKSKRC